MSAARSLSVFAAKSGGGVISQKTSSVVGRERESEGSRSRIDWRQLFRSGGWREGGRRKEEEFEGHAILAPPCLESACLPARHRHRRHGRNKRGMRFPPSSFSCGGDSVLKFGPYVSIFKHCCSPRRHRAALLLLRPRWVTHKEESEAGEGAHAT